MISETYKASETLKLQSWSAEEETSTGSGPRKCAYASCSPACQKAWLSLKRADDCKTLFSLHKVTKNHKIGFFFLHKFSSTKMQRNFQASLAKQYRHASVIVSAAEKRNELKGKGSSLMAHSIPARSSSIRLARTAPGSTRGTWGREKEAFISDRKMPQPIKKRKKKTKPQMMK